MFRPPTLRSDPVQRGRPQYGLMADLLSVLGVAAFVVAMLGLIKALERV